MAATTANYLTIEEFLALPDPEDGTEYELHEGELVIVTYPVNRHTWLQKILCDRLQSIIGTAGYAFVELPYRPTPRSLRRADVAVVLKERWDSTDPDGFFQGSPDLVIEVNSPSNTAKDLERKEALCLRTGCQEFWVVYPDLQTIRVSTATATRRYGLEDSITTPLLPGVSVRVADILGDEQ